MMERQIIDLFTRIDELLQHLLEVQEDEVKILEDIKERLPITVAVPPAPPPRVPPEVRVERPIIISPAEVAKEVSRRLVQMPNRIERIVVETINENWVSLKKQGKIKPDIALGFWIEQVGGGFDYIIRRNGFGASEKTAEIDDKWDIEFDDILVKGYGVSGQGLIWYWWRED